MKETLQDNIGEAQRDATHQVKKKKVRNSTSSQEKS